MIQQTSLSAWFKVSEDLGNRQKNVYDTIIKLQPCSSLDVSYFLHTPLHTISGRFSELKTMGLIREFGIKFHGSRKFKTWSVI